MTIQQTLLSAGSLNWMTQASSNGVAGGNNGRSVLASDSSGNVFIPMSFSGSLYVAVAKLNSIGQFQWLSTSLGDGTNPVTSVAITTDASGNVYMTGSALGADRTYVTKVNSSGATQWTNYYRNASTTISYGQGLRVDSSGNVFVLVQRSSGAFDGGTTYLLKLNSSGSIVWQTAFSINTGTGNLTSGYGIALDSSANIYVCGYGNPTGVTRAFLAKFNSSGTLQSNTTISPIGTGTFASANALYIDASDNIFIVGDVEASSPTYYGVIAKYNSSLTLQTINFISRSPTNHGAFTSITGDISGNLYVTTDSGYVIAFDSSLSPIWRNSCTVGGSSSSVGPICLTSENKLFMYSQANASGAFIGLLPTNGTKTGTYTVGSFSNVYTSLTAPATSAPTYTTGSLSITTGTPTMAASTFSNTGSSSVSFSTTYI